MLPSTQFNPFTEADEDAARPADRVRDIGKTAAGPPPPDVAEVLVGTVTPNAAVNDDSKEGEGERSGLRGTGANTRLSPPPKVVLVKAVAGKVESGAPPLA